MIAEIKCSNCHLDLSSAEEEDGIRVPCPECGSMTRTYNETSGSVRVRVLIYVKSKHKVPGVKKPVWEDHVGKRRGFDGRVVHRVMIIDRQNDRYQEKVTTEDGENIEDKDERLSGHRSRPRKPKTDIN